MSNRPPPTTTTILWLSKNSPLPAQIAELRRLFGDVQLQIDANPFSHAGEIRRRFARLPAPRELAVVAPESVLRHLTQDGVRPLTSVMECISGEPLQDPRSELVWNGRLYRFVRWRRLVRVPDMEYEELE